METRGTTLFREIHKNTWLKRLTLDNRKITVGSKKSERSWVVFCVHDDCEAILEGYIEPRQAASHTPEWTVPLQSTLHISHALVSSEHEYEFVITLATDVVRFNAASWDIMVEWVETLRQKLRELKILSPKDNLYSKLPEIRAPLLPTRDPTSPLPAPPPEPAAIVPGIEPRTLTQTIEQLTHVSDINVVSINSSTNELSLSDTNNEPIVMNLNPTSTNISIENNLFEEQNNSTTTEDEHTNLASNAAIKINNCTSLAKTFTDNVLSDPNTCCSASTSSSNANFSNSPATKSSKIILTKKNTETSKNLPSTSQVTVAAASMNSRFGDLSHQENSSNSNNNSAEDLVGSTNITIIQVSSPIIKKSNEIFNFVPVDVEKNIENFTNNVQIIPSNFSTQPSTSSSSSHSVISNKEKNIVKDRNKITTVQVSGPSSTYSNDYGKIYKFSVETNNELPSLVELTNTQMEQSAPPIVKNVCTVTNIPIGNDGTTSTTTTVQLHYEQIFINPPATEVNTDLQTSQANQLKLTNQMHRKNLKNQENSENSSNVQIPAAAPSTSAFVPSNQGRSFRNNSSSNKRDNILSPILGGARMTRGLTEIDIRPSRRNDNINQRGRTRILIEDSEPTIDTTNQDSREHRRRSSSTSDVQGVRSRTSSSNNNNHNSSTVENRRIQSPAISHSDNNRHGMGRITFREQQVFQLRREMLHPGGVRISLRRKDCVGSIAIVDAFGAVWISGWKQKEHPMLYNVLHIGDQLISISGISISSAAEANKIIRNSSGLNIELILRRVPLGRVFAIKKEMDGQCLGLIRDGNTSTIVDVIPNSLSARHGLPPKTQTCDGLSLTFWVLTEINGRPLNLFFKDFEIRDRLNAIGRDISILVQPADLITKLKKQLKALKNYKDFIVQ